MVDFYLSPEPLMKAGNWMEPIAKGYGLVGDIQNQRLQGQIGQQQLQAGQMGLQKAQLESAMEWGYLNQDALMKQETYGPARQELIKRAPQMASMLPPNFDPNTTPQMIKTAAERYRLLKGKTDPMALELMREGHREKLEDKKQEGLDKRLASQETIADKRLAMQDHLANRRFEVMMGLQNNLFSQQMKLQELKGAQGDDQKKAQLGRESLKDYQKAINDTTKRMQEDLKVAGDEPLFVEEIRKRYDVIFKEIGESYKPLIEGSGLKVPRPGPTMFREGKPGQEKPAGTQYMLPSKDDPTKMIPATEEQYNAWHGKQ